MRCYGASVIDPGNSATYRLVVHRLHTSHMSHTSHMMNEEDR